MGKNQISKGLVWSLVTNSISGEFPLSHNLGRIFIDRTSQTNQSIRGMASSTFFMIAYLEEFFLKNIMEKPMRLSGLLDLNFRG